MLNKIILTVAVICSITCAQNCGGILDQIIVNDTLKTDMGERLLTKVELFGCEDISSISSNWQKGAQGYCALQSNRYAVWANRGFMYTNDSAVVYLVENQKKIDSLWLIGKKIDSLIFNGYVIIYGTWDSTYMYYAGGGKYHQGTKPVSFRMMVDENLKPIHLNAQETVKRPMHSNTRSVRMHQGCYDLRGRKIDRMRGLTLRNGKIKYEFSK